MTDSSVYEIDQPQVLGFKADAVSLMQRYDRPPDPALRDLMPRNVFVEGRVYCP